LFSDSSLLYWSAISLISFSFINFISSILFISSSKKSSQSSCLILISDVWLLLSFNLDKSLF
jgi:hypothetical protein